MRRLWLVFAQAVTVSVAVVFVLQTLKPEWLPGATRPGSTSDVAGPTQVAITTAAALPKGGPPASFADAARKALPAVVHVFTSKEVKRTRNTFGDDPVFRYFFGDRQNSTQRQSGLGSGVVISSSGYILTNNHVIEQADEIEVALNDGRKFPAKLVGADPESDLAVLQIAAGPNLPAITFAAPDGVAVGDVALAIGNPFGVGQTVTQGIVSALGRTRLGINTFEDFIQTDAAVNRGNSGGALVDANGNLIGINTAIFSPTGTSLGIGFAIPVSLARKVMDQIIRTGTVTRGWIGVEVQEITPELAESFRLGTVRGALIAGVMRGSPADRAGVRTGDVLVGVEGNEVKDTRSMLDLIAALQPGQKANIRLQRNNTQTALEVTIGKRPALQRPEE